MGKRTKFGVRFNTFKEIWIMEDNKQKAKKGKLNPLGLIGIFLCVGGSILLNSGVDGLGMIMCIVGIPIAVVSIVMDLKKKK